MAQGERCDLCNGQERVSWVWLTLNEASSLKEAQEKQLFWAEDPEWAVCDTCHLMVLDGRVDDLRARALESVGGTIGLSFDPTIEAWTKIDLFAHLCTIHSAFWAHKTTYRVDA